ncbi:dipeptidase [Plantactinospora soyae]|uniref:Membrane dipeptidase n=1 Tax=Plantactinospora soyae TaxID=1544732 RepID=A0A927R0A6_9ACTN|nr:membrane dipeptidase [Plantactinospora soyae]MBE1491355.1 membrane dipeptidase [Plantactinospora soyae]
MLQEPASRYQGHKSYSYLEPHADYRVFDLAAEVGRVPEHDLGLTDAQRQRVTRLLTEQIAISLHEHPVILPEDVRELRTYNRTARQRTGYEGLARSGLTAVFDNFMAGASCVTSENGWKWNDLIYALGMRMSDLYKQDFVRLATSLDDIRAAKRDGRLALVAGLECSSPIENELDRIDILYGFGVRQLGIAYSQANMLGGGLSEARDGGLTHFGRRAVDRMNKLGIAIDISHSGDQTCLDVIEASRVPVFITHAGARSVWNTSRMKPDDVIRACAERGGVIGIEAAPHTTLSEAHLEHSLDSVMDHFRYCVDLVGIDHVTFGPDTMFGDHVGVHKTYAGNYGHDSGNKPEHPRVEYVAGVENPGEAFGNIVGWLVKHDYSDDEIAKVVGGNTIRVLEQVW